MSRRTGAGTRYSAKGKGSCCTGCVRQMLKESAGRGSGGGGGVASGVAGTISTRVRRHNLSMFAIQPHRVLAKFSAYPVCNRTLSTGYFAHVN